MNKNAIHMLDVGCGNCAIAATEAGTVLIDCYRLDSYQDLLPRDKRILAVFITHQHDDHYGGLEFLITHGYRVDRLIYSPYRRSDGDRSVSAEEWEGFQELKTALERAGTRTECPFGSVGGSSPLVEAGPASFRVVGPYRAIAEAEDRHLHDACLVIRAELGDVTALFPGDASARLQRALAADPAIRAGADLLYASHHGALDCAVPEFIRAVSSRQVFVSTKPGVYDGIPDENALALYSRYSRRLHRTDLDGTLSLAF